MSMPCFMVCNGDPHSYTYVLFHVLAWFAMVTLIYVSMSCFMVCNRDPQSDVRVLFPGLRW